MKHWIAFFSQTGSEINNIRKELNIDPDLIITNRTNLKNINKELLIDCTDKFVFIPKNPKEDDYNKVITKYKDIFDNCFITLNGYLRIIPGSLCEKFTIYNLHPGAISLFPELKGKDPQLRAYEGKYDIGGAVIHKVTAGVDEGEILYHKETSIKDCTLDEVYEKLHNLSTNLWVEFLTREVLR